jgi:hypothetical protein
MDRLEETLAALRYERGRVAAELARLDLAIGALEEIANGGRSAAAAAVAGATGATAAGVAPAVGSPGAAAKAADAAPVTYTYYAALDLYEAAAHYLSTVTQPKNSVEIAAALRAGGFKTRSVNFAHTVRVMLRRKSARETGIHTTSDGRRWFVRP